jgi:hypothetical protein
MPIKKGKKMKKYLVFLLILISSLSAANINKNSFYINLSGGVTDIYTSKQTLSGAVGFYYHFPNIYNIDNRFSLEFNYIDSDADFYITNLKIDWLKKIDFISPFLGINAGYMYFNQNNQDYSSTVLGFQGGLIIPIIKNIDLELSATWQKAVDKQNVWDKSIRIYKGGINIKF